MAAPGQPAAIAPLVLATMASQALLVVLAPTIVAIASDLDASVGAVGQARAITAGVAVAGSLVLTASTDRVGVASLLRLGSATAIAASAAVAASPALWLFLAAHVLVGLAFACLLTAGFAGVAAFDHERRAWALGHVAGANALAWILVNPVVGAIAEWSSWRLAHAVPAGIAVAALVAAGAAAPVPAGPLAPRMRTIVATPSARRWIAAELMTYGAWAALLTFVGAFYIDSLGVGEAVAGWLLASGAAAYFLASTGSVRMVKDRPPVGIVAATSLLMAVLTAGVFATRSVVVAVVVFCLIGVAAGVRTPVSSRLGLDQLPDHPGAMMAARTAAVQLGYLVGAVVGGAVIAGAGYGTLGLVLAAGLAVSAAMVLRVEARPAIASSRS